MKRLAVSSMAYSDEYWMTRALSLAQKAFDAGEVPVGAVIVCDDDVVGEGWNSPISTHDASAHAELVAIRAACAQVKNYRLVNTRMYVTIEPCTMCVGALIHARIDRLVFGAPEPKAGVLASHSHIVQSDIYNHRFDWQGGVLEEPCSQLIKQFFQQRRKEKKAPKEP